MRISDWSSDVCSSELGCVNGTRLFVERSIYEPYLQMLAGIAPHIKIGDPFDRSTIMGPVISEAAVQRIVGVVEAAQRDGARLVAGGARLGGEHADGYFLPITMLADVDHGDRQEIAVRVDRKSTRLNSSH